MYEVSQPVKRVPILCRVKRETLLLLREVAQARFTTPNKILAMVIESERVDRLLDRIILSASKVAEIPAGEPTVDSQ